MASKHPISPHYLVDIISYLYHFRLMSRIPGSVQSMTLTYTILIPLHQNIKRPSQWRPLLKKNSIAENQGKPQSPSVLVDRNARQTLTPVLLNMQRNQWSTTPRASLLLSNQSSPKHRHFTAPKGRNDACYWISANTIFIKNKDVFSSKYCFVLHL